MSRMWSRPSAAAPDTAREWQVSRGGLCLNGQERVELGNSEAQTELKKIFFYKI